MRIPYTALLRWRPSAWIEASAYGWRVRFDGDTPLGGV